MRTVEKSWKYRLLKKARFIFVPPGQLGAVYRDGRFHRFLEPGYHRPIFPWRDQFRGSISTEPQSVVGEGIKVKTADLIEVSINIKVIFRFAPYECDVSKIKIKDVDHPSARLKKVVESAAADVVRRVCSSYKEEELSNGNFHPRLERELKLHLKQRLRSKGLVLLGDAPVSILKVTIPSDIEEARREAYMRRIYAQSLNQPVEKMGDVFHEQALAAKNAQFHFIKTDKASEVPDLRPPRLHPNQNNGDHQGTLHPNGDVKEEESESEGG